MIESITVYPVSPIQQRTSSSDAGDQIQQFSPVDSKASGEAKSDSAAQSDKNPSQSSDQKKKLEEVIKGLNDFLEPRHTSLKFQLYEKLNQYYCQVIDDKTKEVIREIPPKKLLDAYATMAEQLGFIIDKKI